MQFGRYIFGVQLHIASDGAPEPQGYEIFGVKPIAKMCNCFHHMKMEDLSDLSLIHI